VYTGNPFDSNEAILTQEIPGEPREAVKEVIFYIFQHLGRTLRFQSTVANEFLTGNSLNRELPRPIPWDTVRDLCRSYQAHALLAVEVYSSDFKVSTPRANSSAQTSILEDPDQGRYSARATGSIVFGFRVYDPNTETIIDEKLYRHEETWEATGSDPAQAAVNLIRRDQAVHELTQLAAAEYARRISPIYVPVERRLYSQTGNDTAMATGTKLFEDGRLQEAATAWEAGISQSTKAEAGQLAYNLAIAHEAMGDMDRARAWAEKAHKEYGNGQAKAYLDELDGHQSLLARAREQLRIGGGLQAPGVEIQ
jgi:tetratricopeptide (TPR) repeat protein